MVPSAGSFATLERRGQYILIYQRFAGRCIIHPLPVQASLKERC
jgi:hypothetical protein